MISIVIPLYNKADCIEETIQSVLNQTYSYFEIVVVNDGSTDKSNEIVSTIRDRRIRIIDQPNGGVSSARNRGIRESRGTWLLFLDADDVLKSDCLQVLSDLHQEYPSASVCAANYEIHSQEKIEQGCRLTYHGMIDSPFKYRWQKRWNLRLGAFIVNRTCLAGKTLFHPTMTRGEDLFFTDALIAANHIAYTPTVVMQYNRYNSEWSKHSQPIEKCISWYLNLSNEDKFHRLINAEIIWKAAVKSLISKQPENFMRLSKRHAFHIPIIMKSIIYRCLKIK